VPAIATDGDLTLRAMRDDDDYESIVRWRSQPHVHEWWEPDHPAPVLTARGPQPVDDDAAKPADTHATSHSDDGMSTGAIVAIVVGIVIVLALLGFILSRTRRSMGSRTD